MLFYNIWAILKVAVWIWIISYLYNYINIYEDLIIGLWFGFIGIFFVVWWVSFYMFYISQKIFSVKNNIEIASRSYKLSLLFWLFILVNLSLVILDKWNKLLVLWILIIFIILQIVTITEND